MQSKHTSHMSMNMHTILIVWTSNGTHNLPFYKLNRALWLAVNNNIRSLNN